MHLSPTFWRGFPLKSTLPASERTFTTPVEEDGLPSPVHFHACMEECKKPVGEIATAASLVLLLDFVFFVREDNCRGGTQR